ncbi:uncharacterized protein LOC117317737 [Pecten maximus]|uniref:uncharacterized protein LOC117317737 n=1 Tax=Pecten maximus TaxID=6579 RepID=UPI001458C4D8|nr:uncharacterized protein LOC117317737 [Pecten maximus]
MHVVFLLIFWVFSGYGSRGQVLDAENLPRQWQDLVSSVDQKLGRMENLVNAKGQQIDQLENKLQTQASEITSLKRLMSQKDAVLTKLIRQVADLENRVDTNLDTDIGGNIPGNNTEFPGESLPLTNGTVVAPGQSYSGHRDSHLRAQSDDSVKINTKLNQDSSKDLMRSAHYKRAALPVSRQPVAFHAYLSSTITLQKGSTVIFNREMLDQGGGYSPYDGIYEVPVSGTYVITWTMFCYGRSAFQNQLVVNGNTRGSTWTDSDEINDNHQATGTVIIYLQQGDRLFLRMGQTYHGKIFGDYSFAYPTFSGWKLD